jgi:Domain of unknown function (DUF4381)
MTNAPQVPGLTPAASPGPVPGLSFAPGVVGPTPAPIHDIVGPIPFFSGPLWVILVVFLLVILAGWFAYKFWGSRRAKMLTPREAALGALARLRGSVTDGSDHEFGVGVSDVLRRFLGEALGLAAPRQTTEEFLVSLQGSLRFVPAEQEALAAFLHQSDYLKYAQGEATAEQRLALIEAAESFVRSGEKPPEVVKAESDAVPPQDEKIPLEKEAA